MATQPTIAQMKLALNNDPRGEMRATPESNPQAAGAARALKMTHEFASRPFGYRNPPGEMLSGLLGIPDVANTLERMGYGEPLTTGKGMTTKPREEALNAAMAVAPMAKMTKGMPIGAVIKNKGGNWLTGSVENALKGLKHKVTSENLANYTPEQAAQLTASGRLARNDALNNWVDSNLTNYVKKEMATPEDPVRKLGEQGISPVNPEQLNFRQEMHGRFMNEGQTAVAQSPAAKSWEGASDLSISPRYVRDLINPAYGNEGNVNANIYQATKNKTEHPWLEKLEPESKVYGMSENFRPSDLGFDHIMDVLRQDLAAGHIRPEQLNKVSMEQAVRRTHEFDQEMAKKMREAAIKNTEGMPVHKEYPEGYKWIELTKPNNPLPEGYTAGVNDKFVFDPSGKDVTHPNIKALEDALKYEGDTMGHCVGGYCPDVLEGRSRIFSLRSAKGEPHVTVETKPGRPWNERSGIFYDNPELEPSWAEYSKNVNQEARAKGVDRPANYILGYPEWLMKNDPETFAKHQKVFEPAPQSITQIKGKQNAAPKEEYLPYVQDFVKSGNWSDVGDLGNTNLVKIYPESDLAKTLAQKKMNVPSYATQQEMTDLLKQSQVGSYRDSASGKTFRSEELPPEGLARGGPIHMAKGGSDTPKKTVKAYKMFRVHPKHPGKLFPLFVDSNTPVEMHKWIDAKEGEMRNGKVKSKIGDLAYRPGWHAGDLPVATHIGDKDEEQKAEIRRIKELRSAMLQDIGDDKQGKAIVKKMYPFPEWANAPRLRNARHIWAEVDMPHDVDWQSEATKRGYNDEGKFIANQAHITDQLPKGGHYRYKTNANMTGNWLIGGGMKVNRILPDEEVQRINEAAGAADLPRAKPMKQESFGFADGGTVAPEEWMAEEHVNHQPKPIRLSGGGQPPSLDVMKLALTKHGMFSPLEKAMSSLKRPKGTAAEFMTEASKQPGFRKDEVSDRNLQLPDQKLTKAEMLQHLQKSPMPNVSEKVLHDFGDEEEALDAAAQHLFGQSYDEIYDDRKAREKVNNWIKENSSKYSTYQLPGGKNYREVLLQTPHFAEHDEHRIMELEADKRRSPQPSHWGMATGEAKELADLMKRKAGMGEQYHSSHFEGHPNILAHMRMSDRTGPNNEKLLHLEEIQSDWHQEGRKKGYRHQGGTLTPKEDARLNELYAKDVSSMTAEEHNELMRLSAKMPLTESEKIANKNKVPDAPFKKNWHELALKHALHHAAKHGYHGVVITPGQEQAKRYDLSKHINDLQYDPQTKTLSAWDHSGNKVVDKNDVNEDQLSDYIGKEGASKLLAKNPGDTQVKQLFGADLQVGGEGMKGFYDKIVPDYLNKLGKPHGVKVGKVPLEVKPAKSTPQIAAPGIGHFPEPIVEPAQHVQAHHFPITEPMRQQILQGQPMYKQGGIIHKAEGGNVQPNIAQMRMALQQRNPIEAQNIGVNEAPNMLPKIYFSPSQNENDDPTVGNSFNQDGMPIGGVDQNQQQPGQQLMAQQQPGQPPQGAQPPQGGLTPQGGPQIGPQGPTPPMGNMLSMTPQGQTMQALAPQGPPGPPGIPSGPPGAPTQPAPTGMKNGGPAYFDKGGLSSSDQEMDAALAQANSIPRSKKPTVAEMKEAIFQKAQQGLMKPSEALGKHEGAYMHITEADRAKVEKRKHGMRGGVGFSQIGLEEPEYAGRTWGVGKSSVQSKLLNRQKRGLSPEDKSIWTTFIGTPEMHTSNQLVFNRMWNKFQEARKSGLLSPEQEAKMLDILRSAMTKATPKKPAQAIFEPDASFDNTHHLFDTFERRRILSDLMAGNKIGGKKGQIFDASKMIEETTDPRLLHAPTLSVGPHTFSFSGETSHEPHLNKAFPYMLHGEAHPDTFQQIPFTEAAPDFTNQIRQTKGREPGYMDIVRGIPRQHITEKYLTGLQKQGRKKGGDVKLAPTQDTMRLALTKKKAK